MKRRHVLLLSGALSLCAGGCSHTAQSHRSVSRALAGQSQALTTAVVDALQLGPPGPRDPATELALALAREDQRIEGIAPEPIPVPALLDPATAAAGQRALEDRIAEVHRLLAREHTLARRLAEQGAILEQQTNARRRRWTQWIGGGTLLLGGAVALCVFVPAFIPILGRMLAWLVGKLPALAGALGVVSLKAFDAVVRGIQHARASGPDRLPNETGGARFDGSLEAGLSREMDRDHKRLVRARKAALKL